MIVSPSISLIAVGVNRPRGQPPLKHAESDAFRLATAFASQLGPVRPENARILLGSQATWRNLDGLLEKLERRPPDFLVLPFGGHGNGLGIALVDKLYPFDRLKQRIERIGSRGTVLLLDSCGSGGFAKAAALDGISVGAEWGPLLLAAAPGVRVFMASTESGSTIEIDGVGGAFTDSLIRAMRLPVPGDIRVRRGSFVSDELVYRRAARFMRKRGLTATSAGTFGGLPLSAANDRACGTAEVTGVSPLAGGGVEVSVTLRNRRFLPTRIVATASDRGGRWPAQAVDVLPTTELSAESARFSVDLSVSPRAMLRLATHSRCVVGWSVHVEDSEGRVLAGDAYRLAYAA